MPTSCATPRRGGGPAWTLAGWELVWLSDEMGRHAGDYALARNQTVPHLCLVLPGAKLFPQIFDWLKNLHSK